MEQLEARFYNLDELAKLTGANRKSKNFKRDVENTLNKWAYKHEWVYGKGTVITHIPTTPEEILQEILVRQFHVDIQVKMYQLACFISAFKEIDGFSSMPWIERASVLKKYYDVEVTDRTLRSWCSTLLNEDLISKNPDGTYWKTEYKDNEKIQTPIPEEEYERCKEYFKKRSELRKCVEESTLNILHINPDLTYREACKEAWKQIYSTLWSEFGCCYYSCKDFHFKSWIENGELKEVIALAKEIAEKEVLKAQ